MRYPHGWEADGNVFAASSKEKGRNRVYTIGVHVHRPGTPDHTRRISARLDYGQLKKLYAEIKYQLSINDNEEEGGMTGADCRGE